MLLPVADALARVIEGAEPLRSERVPLKEAERLCSPKTLGRCPRSRPQDVSPEGRNPHSPPPNFRVPP